MKIIPKKIEILDFEKDLQDKFPHTKVELVVVEEDRGYSAKFSNLEFTGGHWPTTGYGETVDKTLSNYALNISGLSAIVEHPYPLVPIPLTIPELIHTPKIQL